MTRRLLFLAMAAALAACSDGGDGPTLHLTEPEKIDLQLAEGRVVHRPLAELAATAPRDMADIPLGGPKPADQTVYGPLLVGWQLRGAVPGRAWIIAPEQPGLGLQEIEVDRTYPVLGTVSAVFARGDAWFVQTSHGWITGQAEGR